MRIDKFLWNVRFYKTRSIAADEIKKNRVFIGENPVKSSKEVKSGDIIRIRKNQIEYKIKVLELPKGRVGAKLVADFVQDITDPHQYEILKIRRSAQDYYRVKGEGRPTKKDRREMDEFLTVSPSEDEMMDEEDWNSFFEELREDDDVS